MLLADGRHLDHTTDQITTPKQECLIKYVRRLVGHVTLRRHYRVYAGAQRRPISTAQQERQSDG